MSNVAWKIMYRLGLTPWDHGIVPAELAQIVEGLTPGRVLDVGCGTGTQAIWLAQRGWDVTGVDVVETAIARARRRAADAGVRATFVVGDASREAAGAAASADAKANELASALRGPFDLVLDDGCLHSVSESVREGLVRAYARCTAPGATLVLFAFVPRRGPGPKGAGREELERRLGEQWTLVDQRVDESSPVPRPLVKGGRPTWYVWQRR